MRVNVVNDVLSKACLYSFNSCKITLRCGNYKDLDIYIANKNTLKLYKIISLYLFYANSNQPEERLPDIIWCREPFLEELNEIEALNDIRN